jgi:hypothetical protein
MIPDLTLRVAALTSLACSVATATYVVAQVEPAAVMETTIAYAPTLAVILWLQKDAAQTGGAVRLDWGFFLCWLWLGLIPWYAGKTRGRAGWRLAAGLFGLIAAPYISAILAQLLASYFA